MSLSFVDGGVFARGARAGRRAGAWSTTAALVGRSHASVISLAPHNVSIMF